MQELTTSTDLDYQSPEYKDAYSRINGIVIEGEHEACQNYLSLGEVLAENQEELTRLAKMETRHAKGFQSCGKNLGVTPDMEYAQKFFSRLHDNFQTAFKNGKIATCFVIQGLIIEAFAIAAYHLYIPVADSFARKITENVVQDEYLHLNFAEVWLKANFDSVKTEIEEANRENLPIVWQMLNEVEADAAILAMEKDALVEDFMISYGEALNNIGFSTREIMRMSSHGLKAA